MNELSEFYPYVEMSFIVKNSEIFQKSFGASTSSTAVYEGYDSWLSEWTEAKKIKRKQYLELQLELIESPIKVTRRNAQVNIAYLLHGMFPTWSPADGKDALQKQTAQKSNCIGLSRMLN